MRAAFRNTIAAAVAAAIAISGANVAHADETAIAAVAQVDSDNDGLPDIWEERGVVLTDGTEIPLPDWGADPNRPDLFLQLNWMASEYDTLKCDTSAARECADANRTSYAPSTQSLDDLVALFDDHGISLHIDAGEYYTNIDNYAEVFGGETLDYRDVYFDPNRPEGRQLIDVIDNLGERANIFRAGILGDRMRADDNTSGLTSGLALVNDNAFYVASPGGHLSDERVRNTILHEFGHTLGLRHWGAAEKLKDVLKDAPMQTGYHSVMNYDYQFEYFNYSEQPYFANVGDEKVLIPADWDALQLDNYRIGRTAKSIGARADKADKAEVEEVKQPEEIVEIEQPAPVEVAEEHEAVEPVPAEDAQSQPGVVPAEPAKDELKAEAKAEVKAEVKAEAPKQADNQVNIAAIIGGVVAALAALGIGAAFFAMR